ncbi:MAG: glycosyltransferase family 2 protein [Cytophagaceae bacterium]|nr:glycosyltransferase family 2 protein [Cytophagaceae bacterium]
MKIILPMAGRGSRFSDQGYVTPKPLIQVGEKPMFAWALESVKDFSYDQIIVISLKEHEEHHRVSKLVKQYCGEKSETILLDGVTEGQLCTVLAAKEFINSEEDVLIISSDTIVYSDIHQKIISDKNSEGIISVANMPGDRWSFAATDEHGNVTQVAEKVRISDHASTGIYYFRHGDLLISAGEAMIANNERTRGEFYVIPVYQKLIDAGYKVSIAASHEMWDMGTPASLNEFLLYKGYNSQALQAS